MHTHLLRVARVARSHGRRSMSTVPLLINNKDVLTTTTAPTISPLTNKPVWSFSSASDAHVEEAVQSCQAAFPAWSKTFKTDAEAISLANNTAYGLSAAVFTKDLNRAFKVEEELGSGAVHINSMTVHDEYTLPHGGVKKSGFGRFNGYQGMDEFLYYKTVTWQE